MTRASGQLASLAHRIMANPLPAPVAAKISEITVDQVGLQLAGRPWAEPLLLRLGHAYQQASDWHLRRPPVEAEASA